MQPSREVIEIREIIRRNPELFEALEEYDMTRKIPKLSYRERINLTIDSSILAKFKKYCNGHSYNMSRLIESHIKEELNLK